MFEVMLLRTHFCTLRWNTMWLMEVLGEGTSEKCSLLIKITYQKGIGACKIEEGQVAPRT